MVSQTQSSEHNNNKLYSIPHKFTDYELTPHCELKPLPDKSKMKSLLHLGFLDVNNTCMICICFNFSKGILGQDKGDFQINLLQEQPTNNTVLL